jgi:DNA-binding transcriptional regulator GbsR (MarR family)
MVYDFVKLQSSTNYEISDELEMPLSSVCGRIRELQILNLVEDSGLRRETKYGKQAIVWQRKK